MQTLHAQCRCSSPLQLIFPFYKNNPPTATTTQTATDITIPGNSFAASPVNGVTFSGVNVADGTAPHAFEAEPDATTEAVLTAATAEEALVPHAALQTGAAAEDVPAGATALLADDLADHAALGFPLAVTMLEPAPAVTVANVILAGMVVLTGMTVSVMTGMDLVEDVELETETDQGPQAGVVELLVVAGWMGMELVEDQSPQDSEVEVDAGSTVAEVVDDQSPQYWDEVLEAGSMVAEVVVDQSPQY